MARTCKKCQETKDIASFPMKHSSKGRKYRAHSCYACKYKRELQLATVESKARKADSIKRWINLHPEWQRYKAYRHVDKVLNRETLAWDIAGELMDEGCFYCGLFPSGGLDRIDNKLGHSADNVRPCCEKCNNILGDLPDAAKLILKNGLTEIRQKELLNEWQIPTKRRK